MTAGWMLYTVFVTLLLAGAARAAESALSLYGRSVRWTWAAAAAGSLLPLLAWSAVALGPMRGAAGGPGSALLLPPLPVRPGAALGRELAWPWSPGFPAGSGRWLLVGWGVVSTALLLYGLAVRVWLVRRLTGEVVRRVGRARVVATRALGPAAAGFVRPVLIVPDWLSGLTPRARRTAWLHEREHLEAGDSRLLAAATVAVALVPWNPGLWWIVRRLRQAVELDCDRRVLGRRVAPRRYADLLLEVGRRHADLPFPAAALVTPERSLERRIDAMTRPTVRHRIARAVGLAGATALALAAACETPPPPNAPTGAGSPPTSPAASGDLAGADSSPRFIPRDRDPRLQNGKQVGEALQAAYPARLSSRGVGGRVVLWLYVDRQGRVGRVAIQDSSGVPALDAAARKVGRAMHFRPAVNDGSPVAVWIAQPVIFQPPKGATAGPPSDRTEGGPGFTIRGHAALAPGERPLMFVDGKRLPAGTPLGSVSPGNVACIQVLKGAAATLAYGAARSRGVVQVFTRASAGRCGKG